MKKIIKRIILEHYHDNEQKLFEAIEQFPKIMQRPIIIHGKKAVIGRPPENINKII